MTVHAFPGLDDLGGMVSLAIESRGHGQNFFWTVFDTEATTLTTVRDDDDLSTGDFYR